MPTVLLNINIDKDLRDELKIIAIKQNTTITEILTNYIEEYVNENKWNIFLMIFYVVNNLLISIANYLKTPHSTWDYIK